MWQHAPVLNRSYSLDISQCIGGLVRFLYSEFKQASIGEKEVKEGIQEYVEATLKK